jgi:hypothetical protein
VYLSKMRRREAEESHNPDKEIWTVSHIIMLTANAANIDLGIAQTTIEVDDEDEDDE